LVAKADSSIVNSPGENGVMRENVLKKKELKGC
jgi:hypothetical protein